MSFRVRKQSEEVHWRVRVSVFVKQNLTPVAGWIALLKHCYGWQTSITR